MKEWKAALPITVTEEDVENLLVTAIEGGIDYWCEGIEFGEDRPNGEPCSTWTAKQLIKGRLVKIRDEDGWHSLSIERFIAGITRFLGETSDSVDVEDGRLDTTCIDACDADAIIQYSLFDKLVYS